MNELGISTAMEATGPGAVAYRDEWTVDGTAGGPVGRARRSSCRETGPGSPDVTLGAS
ncbi:MULTISPECIES: hypothetical protein [Oerskovia]|uniref:Uncharacterized protein n=1 Tax=Oerskovia merdavium TaxID=2762227 RepID=A0ABR8U259_9CELL|nr:hypothetical protein [Oerskovia merdavium]MBD7981629.1 hypothetical protein [Oerskovia merdavium]